MRSDIVASRRQLNTDTANLSSDWEPCRIVFELRRRGLSLRKLSLANHLSQNTLYDAVRKPWPRGERIIARALKMRPQDIWPSRYARRSARRAA